MNVLRGVECFPKTRHCSIEIFVSIFVFRVLYVRKLIITSFCYLAYSTKNIYGIVGLIMLINTVGIRCLSTV